MLLKAFVKGERKHGEEIRVYRRRKYGKSDDGWNFEERDSVTGGCDRI